MAAPIGNEFWKFRNKHGRDFEYTPADLWKEAEAYFQWVIDNPIITEQNLGTKNVNTVQFRRPFTIRGFCLYADISRETYRKYRDNKDFVAIIHKIDDILYNQKFEGAVIGIFNSNIIARDLGLKEKTDVTSAGERLEGPTIYLPDNKRARTD